MKNHELYHFSFGRHWEKKDHKYIQKIKTNKGFRYIYDLPKTINKSTNKIKEIQNKKVSEITNTKQGSVLMAMGIAACALPVVKKMFSMSINSLASSTIKQYVLEDSSKDNNEAQTNTKIQNLPKQTIDTNPSQDQALINKNYPNEGYTNNCSYCTLAYDLRQRGYDVEANSTFSNGELTSDILDWYEPKAEESFEHHATTFPALDAMKMENDFKKYPDGARGFFMVQWYGMNGGHAMVWEKVNGKIIIRDCQTNRTMKLKDALMYTSSYETFRTDNVEPNDKCIDKVRKRSA